MFGIYKFLLAGYKLSIYLSKTHAGLDKLESRCSSRRKFSDTFFSNIWMQWLIMGNLTLPDAMAIVTQAEKGFRGLRPGG